MPQTTSASDGRDANDKNTAPTLTVPDLAGIVYSSGKVFDGLSASRHATVNFLRSGSLDGITSRADLALLQDLRDVSQYIIDKRQTPISTTYVRAVNAHITRSGPLHPGRYRTEGQQIGVATPHGRHEPKPVDDAGLKRIVDTAMAKPDPREQALDLFVQIAKAQPFEDGNKRTALFVANSVLIREPEPEMLVVPTGEAAHFNDLLGRAYLFSEHGGIKDLLRAEGFSKHSSARGQKVPLVQRHPEPRDVTIDPHGLSSDEQDEPEDPQLG